MCMYEYLIFLRTLNESKKHYTTCITKYGQSNRVTMLSERSVSYCAMVTYESFVCSHKYS